MAFPRQASATADANHRYTMSRTVRDQMVAKGWVANGDGADIVVISSASAAGNVLTHATIRLHSYNQMVPV